MSVKSRSFGLGFSFIILSLTGLFFLPGAQSLFRKNDVREINLVAKGMMFRSAEVGVRNAETATSESAISTPKVNPTISVKPGEKIQLTIRNEDRGVLHDIVIIGTNGNAPLLKIHLQRPLRHGESETLSFTVPDIETEASRDFTFEYYCSRHPKMMRGEIEIETEQLKISNVK